MFDHDFHFFRFLMGVGGGVPLYVPIEFSTCSMLLECSRMFWNVLEGSRMFDQDFHLFKVFFNWVGGGGGRQGGYPNLSSSGFQPVL